MTTFLTGTPSKPHPLSFHECSVYCVDGLHAHTIWSTRESETEASVAEWAKTKAAIHGDEVVEVRRVPEMPPMNVAAEHSSALLGMIERDGLIGAAKHYTYGFLVFTRSKNGSY